MNRALAMPQGYLPEMNRQVPQKAPPVFLGSIKSHEPNASHTRIDLW
jgi:hypothetical protein